jgi:hypothetical protein
MEVQRQDPRSVRPNQDINSRKEQCILKQLKAPLCNMISVTNADVHETNEQPSLALTIISTHSYPPTDQVGVVSDHDRPFAEYGHLGRYLSCVQCI